jgi:hypothetical protein
MPREIVSPRVIKVIVQEDGWKQAQLERGAWQEALYSPAGRLGIDFIETATLSPA